MNSETPRRQPKSLERVEPDVGDRQQRCYELDRRVRAGLRAGRAAMWMTAEALYEFDRQSGWSALGHEKRAAWLADPEVGITERTYQRLVRVWREAVVRREIDPPALARLDLSKVEIVLAGIEEASTPLPEALADAEALGWRELRRKYSGSGLSPSTTGHQLPAPSTPPPVVADQAMLSAEADDTPSEHTEDTPERVQPARRQPEEEEELENQLARWLALYTEVRQAATSGHPLPQVNAQVIVPGLDALAHLLQAAGVPDIDRLMP